MCFVVFLYCHITKYTKKTEKTEQTNKNCFLELNK